MNQQVQVPQIVTYSIQIQGSDGKNYIADLELHREWLYKKLGITRLQDQIRILEVKVLRLEAPSRQQKILALLKDGKNGHTIAWIRRRTTVEYGDINSLETQGKIEHVYDSIGHSHKYRIKEAIA